MNHNSPAILAGLLLSLPACPCEDRTGQEGQPPAALTAASAPDSTPPDEKARQAFDLLQRGLGYLEEDDKFPKALATFEELIALAPEEAAGHINAAVAILRGAGKGADPEPYVRRVLEREPDNPYAWGVLGSKAYGKREGAPAVDAFSRAVKGAPNEPKFRYRLVKSLGLLAHENPAERSRMRTELEALATLVPHNVVVRLELAEVRRALGDAPGALRDLRQLEPMVPLLGEQAQGIFAQAKGFLEAGDVKSARARILMFRNLLKVNPFYGLHVAQITPALAGVQQRTLSEALEAKVPPAAPPTAIDVKFVVGKPIREGVSAFFLIDADGDFDDDLFVVSKGGEVLRNDEGSFSGGFAGKEIPGAVKSAAAVDLDNDGDLDLLVISAAGLDMLINDGEGSFEASTPEGLGELAKGSAAIEPIDYDHDGDIDIFIGPSSGPHRLLRNDGDAHYLDRAKLAKVEVGEAGARAAGSADIDDDGDIDLLVVSSQGIVALHSNLRQGLFQSYPLPSQPPDVRSAAIADFDNDGMLDLAVASDRIRVLTNRGRWVFEVGPDISLPDGFSPVRLVALDYDNDGFLDLAVGGEGGLRLFRNVGPGRFDPAPAEIPDVGPLTDLAVSDTDRDGDIDFICLGKGSLRVVTNDGGNRNNWLDVRFRALLAQGQYNRTNHFSTGARAEIRAGDLYQLQSVHGNVTHFGIGDRKKTDILRVVWTNGIPQNHYDLEARLDITEIEIQRGSCPFLYTWDGERYVFITDILGNSPLGLVVDEERYAWIDREDFVKVRGDQLRPKDGEYILQVTEELWECTYLDQAELLVVDHPAEVEVFTSEKWSPPPFLPHRIHAMKGLRPPAGAWDTSGNDVLGKLLKEDGVYVADFRRDRYLGVMTRHHLTLDLGDLEGARRIRLVLAGWMHWMDSSTSNLSMARNSRREARPPTLSVPDGDGGWKVAIPFFGGPAGKSKTVVHDLTGLFAGNDYRVRIDTNLEIYWDQILVSTEVDEAPHRATRLRPVSADVHYRGYSRLYREGPQAPRLFDYQQTTREHRWRDIEGFCTRYGEVTELVDEEDDLMVIFGAGDEVTLRFDAGAAPPLPEGWRRDFLFRSVGWVKDGDLNTTHGQTVLPLPFAAMSGYPYGPDEAFPDDEVHRAFLKKYNTRWMDQKGFRSYVKSREALRSCSLGPSR